MRDEKLTLVLEAFLASLGYEIERVEWNKRQEKFDAPIHNAGTCYKTDEFVMRSYCWDEDRPLYPDHTIMKELVKSCEILEEVEKEIGVLDF